MNEQKVLSRLIQYTPAFIKESSEFAALYSAISKTIYRLSDEVDKIKDCYWIGKGLKINAQDNNIFFHKTDTDEEIQARLSNRYDLYTERGTEKGVLQDIKAITGDDSATAEFFDYTESGYLMGGFFMGDAQAVMGSNKTIVSNKKLTQAQKRIIIPIDTQLLYHQ